MTQGNNILVTVAKLSKFKGEVYPNPRESINSKFIGHHYVNPVFTQLTCVKNEGNEEKADNGGNYSDPSVFQGRGNTT